MTSDAPGFYRTGKLAVIRTWGPADGEFPLWTVGSSRKAIDDDDCLFGNDAPSKGTIRIWLRSGGDSFPLAGQGVISYLDTAFGPGVDQRVDIEAAEAEIAALDAERAPPLFPESSGRWIVIGSVVSVLIAAGVIWRKRRVDPEVA